MARVRAANFRQTPRRAVRRLDLKFRVTPLRRMPKSLLFEKLKAFVETGILPEDIEVGVVSYDRKYGRQFRAGDTIDPEDHMALRKFYQVLVNAHQVRIERVELA